MKASWMSHMQANGSTFHYVERARSGGVSHTFARVKSRLKSSLQLSQTGRPEPLARGNP